MIVVLFRNIFFVLKDTTEINGERYFVRGDPMELIKGATLNKVSFLTVNNFDEFNGYSVVHKDHYSQFSPYIEGLNDIEDENKTNDKDESLLNKYASYQYFMERDQADNTFAYKNQQGGDQTLVFEIESDSLVLKNFGGFDVNTIHYSYNQQRSIFSFLFTFQENGHTSISAITFKKSQLNKSIARSEEDYRFTFNNLKLRLQNKNIILATCGKFDESEITIMKSSLAQWNLNDAGLILKLKETNDFPPYSDVNTNCIVPVRKYLVRNNSFRFTGGFVTEMIDYQANTLLPSSIFIMFSEKSRSEVGSFDLETIFKHEVGHFLGLGHEFRLDSIMGYNDFNSISGHDYKALKSLYSDDDNIAEQPFS